ncbi:MAG: NlpC/P60 family protein [Ilumatobacteraceae bacterium]
MLAPVVLATATIATAFGAVTVPAPAVAEAAAFPTGSIEDPTVRLSTRGLFALFIGSDDLLDTALVDLAGELGARLEVEPDRFLTAWRHAERPQLRVMLSALSQVGVSYRLPSAQPGRAFDCSGLVSWAWRQAGVELPTNSGDIISSHERTSIDDLEPGDVVWYPGHVMLALGVDDTIVHAVNRGTPLKVDHLASNKRSRSAAIDPLG